MKVAQPHPRGIAGEAQHEHDPPVPGSESAAAVALARRLRQEGSNASPTRQPARPQAEEKVLNLYIWNDYLAEDTIANFEKETGIKVSVSNYGSNEELDSKLAPGNSGYDIVVPSASSYERQIRSGYYQKLDKSKLPNLQTWIRRSSSASRCTIPDNEYAVLHMWGTTGIGYNVDEGEGGRCPNAPLDSWQLVFDPAVAKKLQKCGIAVLDSATEMFSMALTLSRQGSEQPDSRRISRPPRTRMMKFRPYIRYIDTQRMITDLANGEICVAVGYNGDILQARDRAEENKTGQDDRLRHSEGRLDHLVRQLSDSEGRAASRATRTPSSTTC